MWDEDDYFARWLHGLCAIPLFAWTFFDLYLLASAYRMTHQTSARTAWGGSGLVSAYVGYRCLRYALTGKDNINRDD